MSFHPHQIAREKDTLDSPSSNSPRSHRPLSRLTPDERARLTDAERDSVIALWLRKSSNELSASTAFSEVHRCLVLLGAPHELLLSSVSAISDELRHSEICHWVAEQYAGGAQPGPHRSAVATNAAFRGCNEEESALLFVALHCALNEGIACAYLKRCHAEAQTRLVAEATRDLLSDEIKHARIFYQLIVGRSESEKSLLGEALPALLSSAKGAWTSDLKLDSVCPEGHGTLSASAIQDVVREATRSLVIPGFAQAGIDIRKAEEWFAGGSSVALPVPSETPGDGNE